MSHICNLKKQFLIYLRNCEFELTADMSKNLEDIFKNISDRCSKGMEYKSPEQIDTIELDCIFYKIKEIESFELNEMMRVFWARYLTRLDFMTMFKDVEDDKLLEHYFNDFEKQLSVNYSNEKVTKNLKYMKEQINYLNGNEVPLVVKLGRDYDYSFITQKDYTMSILRSNIGFRRYSGVDYFDNKTLHFYDKETREIYQKGISHAFV